MKAAAPVGAAYLSLPRIEEDSSVHVVHNSGKKCPREEHLHFFARRKSENSISTRYAGVTSAILLFFIDGGRRIVVYRFMELDACVAVRDLLLRACVDHDHLQLRTRINFAHKPHQLYSRAPTYAKGCLVLTRKKYRSHREVLE